MDGLDGPKGQLGDKGFGELMSLKQLEYLNAYGTQMTDDGLAMVASLPKLNDIPPQLAELLSDLQSSRLKRPFASADYDDIIKQHGNSDPLLPVRVHP